MSSIHVSSALISVYLGNMRQNLDLGFVIQGLFKVDKS